MKRKNAQGNHQTSDDNGCQGQSAVIMLVRDNARLEISQKKRKVMSEGGNICRCECKKHLLYSREHRESISISASGLFRHKLNYNLLHQSLLDTNERLREM